MQITTPAFPNRGMIPSKYSCDGDNTSPELNFVDVPNNAQSLVLIMDDPDAPNGTWTHWILYNMPANTEKLAEDVQTLPPGTVVGENSWGKDNYGGPCPPSGTHRYFFKLYALDTKLEISEQDTNEKIMEAIEGHIVAKTQIIGNYSRTK